MDWNDWEELTPTEEVLLEAAKTYRAGTLGTANAVEEVRAAARGAVRNDKPVWQQLGDDAPSLRTPGSRYFQVRLGFEYDLPREARDAGSRFSFVVCSARLWSTAAEDPQPSVYELWPRDLYEGKPRQVRVELGPEIKVGEVGGSLGKITTDLQIGRVAPVIVAFKGSGQREPRWELTPQERELIGMLNVWLWVELPQGCDGARLAMRVDGDVETRLGPIPIRPKWKTWQERPSVLIR